MTSYTPAGKEVADQLLVGQGNRKNLGIERLCNELGELRAKVEALESKYQTMRAATLAWGKDVENLQRWSDQYLKWFEKLEGVKPKMVDLQLTPEQEEEIAALLRPNYPAKPDGSLVERVRNAIASEHDPKDYCWDEARAAIREVIAWLSQARMANSANLLKREVEL